MLYVLQQARAFREYNRLCPSGYLGSGHPFETTVRNALIESSLSFLRKVNEFFGKNSEASAVAFFPDYQSQWLWTKEDCELLNNRVMHLSLCHAIEGDYDWTVFLATHLPEAEKRFDEFMSRVRLEQPELLTSKG